MLTHAARAAANGKAALAGGRARRARRALVIRARVWGWVRVLGYGQGFGLLSLHNPVARAARRALAGRAERGDRPNLSRARMRDILV